MLRRECDQGASMRSEQSIVDLQYGACASCSLKCCLEVIRALNCESHKLNLQLLRGALALSHILVVSRIGRARQEHDPR